MRNGIILHGKPSREKFENPELLNPSDSNWLPWAKRQLTLNGVFTVVPDMPVPYTPNYGAWKREFERHDVSEDTILIGHSAGAGFLVRWLGEANSPAVRKLALVAPWLDPNKKHGDFGNFEVYRNLQSKSLGQIAVFYSSQDDEQALKSVEMVASAVPEAHLINMPSHGHFLLGNSMTSSEFPELIREVL